MLGTNANKPDLYSFLKTSLVFIDWLDHKQGSTDSSYKYGRFGSKTIKGYHQVALEIGDKYGMIFLLRIKKIIWFKILRRIGWNPMDVYIVKKNDGGWINKRNERFLLF